MKRDPIRKRRSPRLRGYDYTRAGAYFVTICTKDRQPLFGDVIGGEMQWTRAGRIVADTWDALPEHYSQIELDAFVIMPNHIHAIIVLVGAGLKPARPSTMTDGALAAGITAGAGFKPAPTTTSGTGSTTLGAGSTTALSEIVRGFKTFSARRINEMRDASGVPVWQRGYHEHIIRSADSLNRIRRYIAANPRRWMLDRENPSADGLGRVEPWEAPV